MVSMDKAQSIHRATLQDWHTHGLRNSGGQICHDVNNKLQNRKALEKTAPLRLGFVPLIDCAPLVMAHELGLFSKYGLNVTLQRQLGWATVRDKLIHGELDAAHA